MVFFSVQVISQLYYGRPTYTPLVVGVPPLNCSGFVDMMALPEENLTLNENVTDFQLLPQFKVEGQICALVS